MYVNFKIMPAYLNIRKKILLFHPPETKQERISFSLCFIFLKTAIGKGNGQKSNQHMQGH